MSLSACPCAPVCPVADFEYAKLQVDYFLREYPWLFAGMAVLLVVVIVALCGCCFGIARTIINALAPECRQCRRPKGKATTHGVMPPTTPSKQVSQECPYLYTAAKEIGFDMPLYPKFNEDCGENVFAENRPNNRDNNNNNNQGQGQGKKNKNKGGGNQNNQNQGQGKKNKNKGGGNQNNNNGGNNGGGGGGGDNGDCNSGSDDEQ